MLNAVFFLLIQDDQNSGNHDAESKCCLLEGSATEGTEDARILSGVSTTLKL